MTDDRSADVPAQRVHHIDAVHFVHHALKHAIRDVDHSTHVTGESLCRILLELAVDEFGAEGSNVLKQWNVNDSNDVALIVTRMRAAEVVESQRVDLQSDFADWFDLHQAPETWKLKW